MDKSRRPISKFVEHMTDALFHLQNIDMPVEQRAEIAKLIQSAAEKLAETTKEVKS